MRSGLQDLVTRQLPFQRISLDKTDVDERLNKDMTDYILTRLEFEILLLTRIFTTKRSTSTDE